MLTCSGRYRYYIRFYHVQEWTHKVYYGSFQSWATISPYTYNLWPNLLLMHVHAVIVYTHMHTSNLVEISQTLKCLISCFNHTFFNQLTEYTSGASKCCFVVLISSCMHIHMPCTYMPKLV